MDCAMTHLSFESGLTQPKRGGCSSSRASIGVCCLPCARTPNIQSQQHATLQQCDQPKQSRDCCTFQHSESAAHCAAAFKYTFIDFCGTDALFSIQSQQQTALQQPRALLKNFERMRLHSLCPEHTHTWAKQHMRASDRKACTEYLLRYVRKADKRLAMNTRSEPYVASALSWLDNNDAAYSYSDGIGAMQSLGNRANWPTQSTCRSV
eukprot:1142938-Pelagomonas_calceolata.AAC.4